MNEAAPVTPSGDPQPPETGAADKSAAEWDLDLAEAAKQGTVALVSLWSKIPREHKQVLEAAKDRRHKPTAIAADRAKEQA